MNVVNDRLLETKEMRRNLGAQELARYLQPTLRYLHHIQEKR